MELANVKILSINFGERLINLAGSVRNFQNRTDYGLVFLNSGHMRFVTDGREYHFYTGDIFFIARTLTYTLTFMEETQFFVTNFSTLEDMNFKDFKRLDVSYSPRFRQLINRFISMRTFQKPAWQLHTMGMLYELLALLQQCSSSEYTPNSTYKIIEPSIEYIETSFDDSSITNEKLAAISNVCVAYFRRLFTSKYSMPPMRYIQQKRIEKAKELLLGGYCTIEEIAYTVGFNSQDNFSRAFRQQTGLTPKKYIQHNSQGEA